MSTVNLSFIETVLPTLVAISSIVGVVLCAFVLYLSFTKNVNGMFNVYIGNLVVIDIIIAFFYIFIAYFWQFYINEQKSDPFYCMIYESMHYHFIRSFVPLAFMPATIHRIFCVLFPFFSNKWFSAKKLTLFAVVVDLIALYFFIETWFRETAYPYDKQQLLSWCNFSEVNWVGDTGFEPVRDVIDFTEAVLQSNYYPIIWVIILLLNFVTVFKAIQNMKYLAIGSNNMARVKETYQVALITLLQVIIPLLNSAVGYIPNTLYHYYKSNGWAVTPLYDISYVGIFLISLNPLSDALIILLLMPPYRKAAKRLTIDRVEISVKCKSQAISVAPSIHQSNDPRLRSRMT